MTTHTCLMLKKNNQGFGPFFFQSLVWTICLNRLQDKTVNQKELLHSALMEYVRKSPNVGAYVQSTYQELSVLADIICLLSE